MAGLKSSTVGDTDPSTLLTIIRVQDAINDADGSSRAVMHIVADQACQATGAAGAVIELAEGDEMVYTVTSGSLRGKEGLRLALVGSLSGEAVRVGRILISDDTETDDRVDLEACRRVGARSMIVVPLIAGQRVQGVLKVVSGRPQAFGADHVSLLEQLAHFIARALQRAASLDQKSHEAESDSLTGLANRPAFLTALHRSIAGAAGSDNSVAVLLYLGVDGVKPINDEFGRVVGDEVLREIGHRISASCGARDLVARLGGDEFAVLVEPSGRPDVMALRDRLVTELQKPISTSTGTVTVGASCGAAVVGGTDLAEAAVARADAAMSADKRLESGSREHLQFEEVLSRAIREGRLVPYAQPIVEARTGRVVEEELLVRMVTVDGQVVLPDDFLPQARRFGLMPSIDRFMVTRGIELARDGRHVAVNLSADSINDRASISAIIEQLRQAGDEARRVSFEITEHAALASTELAEHFSDEMRTLGCRLALDDFGTGFGTLTELRGMALHALKIDQRFVAGLLTDAQDEAVVRAIVGIAREFGLCTTAEGVEDAETRARLVELGVDQLQGYLIGRPAPVR